MERLKGCLHVNEDLALVGGAEKIIRQTALELNRRGINVGVVSVCEFEPATGLKEFILPFFNGIYSSEEVTRSTKQVISLMEKSGYDLLHAHSVNNHGLIESLTKYVPIFKTVWDSRAVCPSEFKTRADGSLCEESIGEDCLYCMGQLGFSDSESEKRLVKAFRGLELMGKFSYIFTPSEYTRQQLLLNGVNPNFIRVIPLFLSRLAPKVEKSETRLFQSDILFVGRLIESKGIDELLAAFSLLEGQYSLTIIGERPSYAKPRNFLEENTFGQRVRFVGWIDNDKIDNYYQGTKVCVVPSMGPESFCLVGLEAMRNKKPVVAFDSGGIPEWLKDGENGILVSRGEVYTLAEKIKYLLDNPDLAREMGENGYRMLTSQFTKEHYVDELLNFYNYKP